MAHSKVTKNIEIYFHGIIHELKHTYIIYIIIILYSNSAMSVPLDGTHFKTLHL